MLWGYLSLLTHVMYLTKLPYCKVLTNNLKIMFIFWFRVIGVKKNKKQNNKYLWISTSKVKVQNKRCVRMGTWWFSHQEKQKTAVPILRLSFVFIKQDFYNILVSSFSPPDSPAFDFLFHHQPCWLFWPSSSSSTSPQQYYSS